MDYNLVSPRNPNVSTTRIPDEPPGEFVRIQDGRVVERITRAELINTYGEDGTAVSPDLMDAYLQAPNSTSTMGAMTLFVLPHHVDKWGRITLTTRQIAKKIGRVEQTIKRTLHRLKDAGIEVQMLDQNDKKVWCVSQDYVVKL